MKPRSRTLSCHSPGYPGGPRIARAKLLRAGTRRPHPTPGITHTGPSCPTRSRAATNRNHGAESRASLTSAETLCGSVRALTSTAESPSSPSTELATCGWSNPTAFPSHLTRRLCVRCTGPCSSKISSSGQRSPRDAATAAPKTLDLPSTSPASSGSPSTGSRPYGT